MNCHRVRETVFLVSDNEAGTELLAPFKEHLSFCPECARYFSYVNRLLLLVRERCCRYEAPSELRERILAGLPHRRSVASDSLE